MRRLLALAAAAVSCVAPATTTATTAAATTVTTAVSTVASGSAHADTSGLSTRLSGADRYATAVAIAGQYSPGVPVVYIATGLSYPDALAAGAAAGTQSPVLLVAGSAIPAGVAAQVQRLQPGKVVLVGGPKAVPDSVGDTLGAYATNGWKRLSGDDRYATAAAVSAATFSPGVSVVYVATGANFPDALSGASLGALQSAPVLLTAANTLPAATAAELTRLHPSSIDILGGEQAVSSAVQQALAAYSPSVSRDAGSSRYDTNIEANANYQRTSSGELVVATGQNFPDALAGAALAGHLGAQLLLVGPGALDDEQNDFISGYAPTSLVVLGGLVSVSDATVTNVLVAAGLETPPPTAQADDYALTYDDGDQVVRWNPCQTIGWMLNAPGASQATIDLINESVAQLAAASGLTFHYDGTTTFVTTDENTGSEPDDIIVTWLPASQTDLFDDAPGAAGIGGTYYVWGTGVPLHVTHGYAYMDATSLADFSTHVQHTIVLHELGHAVGLMHATYPTEVMYPSSDDDSPIDYSAGDRAGLAKVGAAAGCIS